MTSGCLISPPNPLEAPERIAPSVFMDQVTPSLLKPVLTYSNPSLNQPFSAPFVSEDLGQKVFGILYLNYNSENIVIGSADLAGSDLDEHRVMNIDWSRSLNRPAGCHSVTMAITHSDNFDGDLLPKDKEMTAFVTWWVSHDSALQDVTLADCDETSTLSQ
jgi:hypothetical protein